MGELFMSLMFLSAWTRFGLSFWYAMVVLVGLCLLGISSLFGGGDHDFDHDIDHDIDHDVDHDAGHETGHGHNMSFLSFTVISAFITGFGAGGFVGARLNFGAMGSSFFGIMGGLFVGFLAYTFFNYLYKHQINSAVKVSSFIGCTGVVETSIYPGQVGQVSCRIGDQQELFLARARTNNLVPVGSRVTVSEVTGSTLIVELVESQQTLSTKGDRQ